MMRLTRRKLVKTLLALGAGGFLPTYLAAFKNDGKALAATGESDAFSVFRDVSVFVTLHDDLDPDAVKAMYDVFKDEPWADGHLKGIHEKIIGAMKARAGLKDKSWGFSEGESWFAGHLLTTWYLGIYYHQERAAKRITYEHALMFKPLAGSMPVPFLEPVGYGAWAEKPEGAP